MTLSSGIKIALASAAGATIISTTLLFPLIKDINKSINAHNEVHTPLDNESNKTVQVISKDPSGINSSLENNNTSIRENPSLNEETITSTNDPHLRSSDTIKSSILIEDIPHYRRN